jgi:dipeptidyl aminopeptidase/acylaminoacyl peptidase
MFKKYSILCIIIGIISSCQYAKNTTSITFEELKDFKTPSFFAVSPDGDKIAYVVGDSLFVGLIIEPDNAKSISSGLALESNNAVQFLVWSNVSNQLIFRRNSSEVVLSNVDGSQQQVLVGKETDLPLQTLLNFYMEGPRWSPNDRYLTFPAKSATQKVAQLWSYDLKEKKLYPITNESEMVVSHDWIDENHLVYSIGAFIGSKGAVKELTLSTGTKTLIAEGNESVFTQVNYNPNSELLFSNSSSYTPYLFIKSEEGIFEKYDHKLPRANYRAWSVNGKWLLGLTKQGLNYLPFKVHIDSSSFQIISSDLGTYGLETVRKQNGKSYVFYTKESGNLPKSILRAEFREDGDSLQNQEFLYNSVASFGNTVLPKAEIISWDQGSVRLSAQLFVPQQLKVKSPLILIPYANSYLNRFPNMDYFLEEGILLLTSRGYAVALANNSGGTNRNRKDKEYGPLELRDALGFLETVGNHAHVDTSTVALIGHSHGATMVGYFISHSNKFDAAIAINGAYDWSRQATEFAGRMYGFPYGMGGTPEELPEKYKQYSPIDNIGNITTPILLVAGEKDGQIPAVHAESFYQGLLNEGKDVEYLSFEGEEHLIEKNENQRLFWEKVVSFLAQRL